MKKIALIAALTGALATPMAKADTILGLYIGAEGWQSETEGSLRYQNNSDQTFNFDDETFSSVYAALEHPVPFIPNLKVRHTELELNGSGKSSGFQFGDKVYAIDRDINAMADLTHTDFVLYYEIFDNDLVSIDLGLNGKRFDGNIVVSSEQDGSEEVSFSGVVPTAYGRAEVGFPLTGLSAFAEGSFLSVDDNSIADYQVGIAYEFIDNMAVDMALRVGYRSMVIELDDVDDVTTDLDISGPFAGLQIHF